MIALDDYISLILSFLSLQLSWENAKEKEEIVNTISTSDMIPDYIKAAANQHRLHVCRRLHILQHK